MSLSITIICLSSHVYIANLVKTHLYVKCGRVWELEFRGVDTWRRKALAL